MKRLKQIETPETAETLKHLAVSYAAATIRCFSAVRDTETPGIRFNLLLIKNT
jgi:hypothetical protein